MLLSLETCLFREFVFTIDSNHLSPLLFVFLTLLHSGFRLTQEFAQALLPNKKVAHVHAISDKSHGFVYLVGLLCKPSVGCDLWFDGSLGERGGCQAVESSFACHFFVPR